MNLMESVNRLLGRGGQSAEDRRLSGYTDTIGWLEERLADLELALEDGSAWRRLSGGDGTKEFSRHGLKSICELARVAYIKSPVIRRGVETKKLYVWAQGHSVQAKDPDLNEVAQAFLDDERNKAAVTGHQACGEIEAQMEIDGNIFFAWFVSPYSGECQIRTIPFSEIADRITAPGDAQEPRYYLRRWSEQDERGQWKQREAWYPDWRYTPAEGHPPSVAGIPVEANCSLQHVAVNRLPDQQWGVCEFYSALDWAKAYAEFLANWASIVKAYARFAWKMKVKGGPGAVAAAKDRLHSRLGTTGRETNPAPNTGSTHIENDGVSLDPIKTAGATTSADDARRLLLMVCATFGIFEHYFGDPSTGNLASTKAMERPMELLFLDRQALWRCVRQDQIRYVLGQAAVAPAGALRGRAALVRQGRELVVRWPDGPPRVEVNFPPLTEHSQAEAVAAVVSAATLDGKALSGLLEARLVARLLLSALSVPDADEILAEHFPEGEDWDPPALAADPDATTQRAAEALLGALAEARRRAS